MDLKQLSYGLISALIVGLILYFVKDFHESLEEIESRLDFAAGYERAKREDAQLYEQHETSETAQDVPAKAPCNCGGH